MSEIDEIIFPVFLFIVYSIFAAQFQFLPAVSVAIDETRSIPTAITIDEPITVEESSDRGQSQIDREWLETQSLANLKAIAAELCITVTSDKRCKANWISAIVSATPSNTVLVLDPCFAL